MVMAVAVGVEAVNKCRQVGVPSDAAYRTAEQSNVFSGKMINYESISTIDQRRKDKRGEIYRYNPANQFLN